MSLVFENVIIRTACIVFRDFMSLVKHDQILSLFNQARDEARGGGAKGVVGPPPPSLIERFSKDNTTPLTTPKRGKNDVEMPFQSRHFTSHWRHVSLLNLPSI